MKVTNSIAQAVIDELKSSLDYDQDDVSYALVSLHEQDDTQHAQIAAECLQRVVPNITAGEHVQVATDVLRWYADGDDLDYNDAALVRRIDEQRTF